MFPNPTQQQQGQPDQVRAMAAFVYVVCSIPAVLLEMLLRPLYGSRYVSPVTQAGSAILYTLLGAFGSMGNPLMAFLPFAHPHGPAGLFGLAALAKLYYLLSFIHSIRTWYLMTHMHAESHSFFEGSALPIFRILPLSFWPTRIIVEPLTVCLLAWILSNFYVLQSSAAGFLYFCSATLAVKEYVAWFLQWSRLRDLMDAKCVGPIIAKLVDNTATSDELATIHLASIPKNVPEEVRRETVAHIARAYRNETEK